MQNITPRKAILLECRKCVGGNITLCISPKCKLFPYRLTKTEGKPSLSPLNAIKAHCHECTGYNKAETKNCTSKDCYLYPYRLGKMPQMKRRGNSHQLQQARLQNIRSKTIGNSGF